MLPHVRLTTISQGPADLRSLPLIWRAIARVEGGTIGERDIVLTAHVDGSGDHRFCAALD